MQGRITRDPIRMCSQESACRHVEVVAHFGRRQAQQHQKGCDPRGRFDTARPVDALERRIGLHPGLQDLCSRAGGAGRGKDLEKLKAVELPNEFDVATASFVAIRNLKCECSASRPEVAGHGVPMPNAILCVPRAITNRRWPSLAEQIEFASFNTLQLMSCTDRRWRR